MRGGLNKLKRYWPELVVCLLLALAVHLIYAQAITFSFVEQEDDILFAETSARLAAGGTPLLECLRMTSNTLYWCPVATLVLFTDVWLCGDNKGLLHLMNVSTHAVNTVLLFLVLRLATGCIRRSALVAGLSGLHPINTETVVSWTWGATQVEALMTMIFFLAYIHYARKPSLRRYLPLVPLFMLGLLSRPSIVYLPVILLLFDYWPLDRWLAPGKDREERRFVPASWRRLALEKLPLLLISTAWLGATLYVLGQTPAFPSALPSASSILPENFRHLFNLPVAYVLFLCTLAAPINLPDYFPHPYVAPFMMPLWQVMAAVVILLLLSVLVIRKGRTYPFLITGWFWFLIALFPSAMVCVNQQKIIMARLGYLPVIGVFIIVAWGGALLLRKLRSPQKVSTAAAVCLLGILSIISFLESRHWTDRVSYFRHAVDLHPDSAKTRVVLGEVLYDAGRVDEAVAAYRTALRLDPDYAVAHNHLGLILAERGDREEALAHLQSAVRLDPGYVQAHNNLANLLADLGDLDGAIRHYDEALRINPDLFQVHNNLATVLLQQGRYEQAIGHLRQALAINPGYETARENLAKALQMRKGY